MVVMVLLLFLCGVFVAGNTLKKVFCHKWESSFRDSAFMQRPSLISTKNRAMAQQLAVKTSPTADLHHVDVIAHTTPITATNSLNCRQ